MLILLYAFPFNFMQGLTSIGDSALDFSLALHPDDEAVTTVSPGDKFTIIFEATIPATSYVENVIIEIFTDDADGTFATLCEPTLTEGNTGVDTERTAPVLTSYTTNFLISVRIDDLVG